MAPTKKGATRQAGASKRLGKRAGKGAGKRANAGSTGGSSAAPTGAAVRAFQVGFGDCFLLTVRYADRDRHILIDFGSTGRPRDQAPALLGRVAEEIAAACGGKLDAVVATHRHRDHISGFSTEDEMLPDGTTSTGDLIRSLKPTVVIQPWTEHPDLERDATSLAGALGLSAKALPGHRSFVGALRDMETIAALARDEGRRLTDQRRGQGMRPTAAASQLGFLGQNNLPNRSAVANLQAMGERHEYVFFGSKSGLESILPGVEVHVLGPPTLEQTETIRKQRSRDKDEFWHFQSKALARALSARGRTGEAGPHPAEAPLFPEATSLEGAPPPYARWFVPRMRSMQGDQLVELVRALDDAMNNTSVILLFEFGEQALLFPGDAQIENWSYALSQPDVRARLAKVTLYKVGHHGSLNATPKTLWGLFEHRGDSAKQDRLITVMSTLSGKHGSTQRGTEVPRRKLVAALKRDSTLCTTEGQRGPTAPCEIVVPL
jgi:hypothetical protein